MTDTPEAVRLAALLEQWARDYAGTTYEEDTLTQSAALLRRIPELEAEVQEQARLNGMGAERELALMAQVSRLEAELDQLRAELEKVRWQPIETAPKGQSVLLWVTRGGDRCVIDYWGDYDRHNHPRITHWMPLPAAPTPPNADQKGQ